jgi:hypothetical protein
MAKIQEGLIDQISCSIGQANAAATKSAMPAFDAGLTMYWRSTLCRADQDKVLPVLLYQPE